MKKNYERENLRLRKKEQKELLKVLIRTLDLCHRVNCLGDRYIASSDLAENLLEMLESHIGYEYITIEEWREARNDWEMEKTCTFTMRNEWDLLDDID